MLGGSARDVQYEDKTKEIAQPRIVLEESDGDSCESYDNDKSPIDLKGKSQKPFLLEEPDADSSESNDNDESPIGLKGKSNRKSVSFALNTSAINPESARKRKSKRSGP